jgi:hypothetical protein
MRGADANGDTSYRDGVVSAASKKRERASGAGGRGRDSEDSDDSEGSGRSAEEFSGGGVDRGRGRGRRRRAVLSDEEARDGRRGHPAGLDDAEEEEECDGDGDGDGVSRVSETSRSLGTGPRGERDDDASSLRSGSDGFRIGSDSGPPQHPGDGPRNAHVARKRDEFKGFRENYADALYNSSARVPSLLGMMSSGGSSKWCDVRKTPIMGSGRFDTSFLPPWVLRDDDDEEDSRQHCPAEVEAFRESNWFDRRERDESGDLEKRADGSTPPRELSDRCVRHFRPGVPVRSMCFNIPVASRPPGGTDLYAGNYVGDDILTRATHARSVLMSVVAEGPKQGVRTGIDAEMCEERARTKKEQTEEEESRDRARRGGRGGRGGRGDADDADDADDAPFGGRGGKRRKGAPRHIPENPCFYPLEAGVAVATASPLGETTRGGARPVAAAADDGDGASTAASEPPDPPDPDDADDGLAADDPAIDEPGDDRDGRPGGPKTRRYVWAVEGLPSRTCEHTILAYRLWLHVFDPTFSVTETASRLMRTARQVAHSHELGTTVSDRDVRQKLDQLRNDAPNPTIGGCRRIDDNYRPEASWWHASSVADVVHLLQNYCGHSTEKSLETCVLPARVDVDIASVASNGGGPLPFEDAFPGDRSVGDDRVGGYSSASLEIALNPKLKGLRAGLFGEDKKILDVHPDVLRPESYYTATRLTAQVRRSERAAAKWEAARAEAASAEIASARAASALAAALTADDPDADVARGARATAEAARCRARAASLAERAAARARDRVDAADVVPGGDEDDGALRLPNCSRKRALYYVFKPNSRHEDPLTARLPSQFLFSMDPPEVVMKFAHLHWMDNKLETDTRGSLTAAETVGHLQVVMGVDDDLCGSQVQRRIAGIGSAPRTRCPVWTTT